MNSSFSKKLKTTVQIINPRLAVISMIMSAIYIFNGIKAFGEETTEVFLGAFMGMGYGAFNGTFTFLFINGMFFQHIGHLRTLPFTKKDIKDISLLNIFLSLIMFMAVQCVLIAFVNASAIPHFICIGLVNAAFSIWYLLLCMFDKRNWDVKAARQNQFTRREKVPIFITMIFIMIASCAVDTVVFILAVSKSLAESVPALIGISAAALIAIAVQIIVYRKKDIDL